MDVPSISVEQAPGVPMGGIELNLDLLALDLTNDPDPVRFDGTPPDVEPDKVMMASLIDMPGLLVQSVVGQTPGGSIYYYINDHLGTPQKMVDQGGTVVWSADYEPFGQAAVTVNTVTNNFRFPGQYLDEESCLHYNYHRYYDPKIGRYLGSDPLGVVHFESFVGWSNLFLYAEANPITKIDPSGLDCFTKCWRECIKENYGSSFDTALGLSFIGVVQIAQSVYNGAVEAGAKQKLKNLDLAGAFTEGDITKKMYAAEKAAKSAKSLSSWTKVLSGLSKVSSIISAGATGYVAGASAYCTGKCL